MSLNGLDSPEVWEAYQSALVEPGGWLLLKYTTRDSVDLLGRGKAGVSEARHAIAAYDQPSPLYGLIIYRRRKVLIKYVPEGTSRVLQARTAVHFQDVLEKYAPYETLLEIKTSEGLNDTTLASSFHLRTATPSGSSSRLDEISEDAEDGGAGVQTPTSQATSSSSYFPSQRHKTERSLDQSPPSSLRLTNGVSRVSSSLPSPKKTSVSQYLVRDDSGQRSITSLMSSSLPSTSQYAASEESSKDAQSTTSAVETPKTTIPVSPPYQPSPPRVLESRAPSSPTKQSSPPASPQKAPEIRVPSSPSNHSSPPTSPLKMPEKPRERPLPTTEVRIPKGAPDRPLTSRAVTSPPPSDVNGISEQLKFDDDPYDWSRFDIKPKVKLGPRPVEKMKRPTTASVSSIPATYKPTARSPEQPRPKSQGPTADLKLASLGTRDLPAPPPIPDMPEYNPRPLSRGSVKSMPSHKSGAMTPDKIRLMKAVELRKKQLRKSNPQASTFVPPPDEEVPAVPQVPEQQPKNESEMPAPKIPQVETISRSEQEAQVNKVDSGIAMEYEKIEARNEEPPTEPSVEIGRQAAVETYQPTSRKSESRLVQRSPRIDTPRKTSRQITREPEFEPIPQPSRGERIREDVNEMPNALDSSAMEDLLFGPEMNGLGIGSPPPKESPSVPRIVMADGSRPMSANAKQPKTREYSPVESDTDQKSPTESDLELPEKNVRRQNSDIAKRRRGFVEPLHLDGDDDFVSDEEFMEELRTATLHEAKPMTVAKSPVAHYFPRRPSAHSAVSDLSLYSARAINVDTQSSDLSGEFVDSQEHLSPDPASESYGYAWSASTPPMERNDPIASLKRNVSTGITKRIQALSDRSSRENSPPDTSANGPVIEDRTDSTRSQPFVGSRTSSFRAMSRHSSKFNSSQNQLRTNGVPPPDTAVHNVQKDPATQVDSVSVTARIVRPSTIEPSDEATETESELQPSQLVISHKRGTPSQPGLPQLHRIDTNSKPETSKLEPTTSRGSSPTMTRGSADGPRQLHSSSKFGRHKAPLSPLSPTADDFPPPPSSKFQASNSAPPADDNAAAKENTRTSRFFKRMSNIGGKRKSGGFQSVAGSSSSPASDRGSLVTSNASLPSSKDRPEPPPALVVGDLNIQFPDSLLWKRRIVEIDDAGYVVFLVTQATTEHQRSMAKKFQLLEFRMPYIPDLDRQELPNSIMLDFIDGTTLQIACEDTMTHRQVLHVLKSYWKAWSGT